LIKPNIVYKRKTMSMKRVLLLFVLLLAVAFPVLAQTTHTVTGKILDEYGHGYSGASITVKGMQIGTLSDVNGDFMLDVPDGYNEFVIQAVGYTNTNAFETDGSVNVKLRAMSKQLEGPIMTAQTILKDKRELGYAATKVEHEELTEGGSTSAISALAGKAAGANITSSTGGPGGSSRMVLRGENSFMADNNPIYVVDGVILNNYDRTRSKLHNADNTFSQQNQVDFGNSANDISLDDIESEVVMNGVEATVLYGSMGAHGAVIITTKTGKHKVNGKKSKMEVTYKASYTQSDVLKYADLQHEYGQGNIYDRNATAASNRTSSWGLLFDGNLRPWGQAILGKQLVKPYSDEPNNMSNFFNHGKDLNNYVSVAGGGENSTYLLSINSLNSNGVVPNTFYNKYSVRFNGTIQLSNHFYSAVNVNYLNTYSRADNNGSGVGSAVSDLYNAPRDIPTWELQNYTNKYYAMDYYDNNGVERYGAYGANPHWVAKNYQNLNKSDRVLGDFKVGYKKGSFNFYDRVGIDVTADRSYYNTPIFDAQPTDPTYAGMTSSIFTVSPGTVSNASTVGSFISPGGYTQSNYNGIRLYNDLVGNYTHALSSNFGLNVTVGHNVTIMQDQTLEGIIYPATNGLLITNFYNLQNNVNPVIAYNNTVTQRMYGVYADVALNFQKELFVNLTGRNDWSSTLDANNNSYFYPGANAAWVFTERLNGGSFKEKVLEFGKIRIGAGGVGNSAVPYVNNAAGYAPGLISTQNGSVTTPFNGIPVYQVQNAFGAKGLRPEQTRELETGADLGFFKNRIGLSFTYYSRYTDNMIAAVPIAPSSGFSYNYQNVGDVTNKGEEITLKGTPIATRWGLKWDLFGTYTHNVNDVQSLTNNVNQIVLGGTQGMAIVAAVGHPYGTFYAQDIQYWQDPKTGNWHAVVNQATGLPVATTKPVYRGSFQPKFQASWGTSLNYKGIKLSVLFVTKQGGSFYSQQKMNMDMNGTSQETVVNNRQPYVWGNSVYQVANTNTYLANNTKFLPYTYYTSTEQQLGAQGLVDASFIKLQEAALSYKIPHKYYMHSVFGSLEAGIYGNNLFIWTTKSNHYGDPEEFSAGATGNGQGFNYIANMSLRNYGAFIKVTF
jgi:TonB-linked SusC/RagA family outer membrane protein